MYGKERNPPQYIAKPFSMLAAEGRRSPLVQRLLVFPLVDARLSLQPDNVPYLNISQLISITCTFPGSLLAGGLALPGSKVSDDHRNLSDIYSTLCPKKIEDAWINDFFLATVYVLMISSDWRSSPC